MAQFLFITDLHVKINNFPQLKALEDYLQTWFLTNRIDYIVVGGDTLDTHERLCSLALTKAANFLLFLTKYAPVFILVGNHDYINNSQFLTDKHWLNVLKPWPRMTVVDYVISREIDDKMVVFCPYVPPGLFSKALATLDTKPNLIFAHQEFRGCKLGGIFSEQGDAWSGPLVISGHIHEKHSVGNVFYPGSSLAHASGYKTYGPCVVSLQGAITFIGFEQEQNVKKLFAPVTKDSCQAADRLHIRGTSAEIAMSLGNPLLKPFIKKSKFSFTNPLFDNDWETFITKNLTSLAMRADYADLVRLL